MHSSDMRFTDQRPKAYKPIREAIALPYKTIVNVVGFVTDVMEPRMTKNDWMTTLSICDPEFMNAEGSWRGEKVRFFRAQESDVPKPRMGDIVILKNITRMEFSGAPIFLSTRTTVSMVFDHHTIPNPDYAEGYAGGKKTIDCVSIPSSNTPSTEDQIYVMFLQSLHGEAMKAALSLQTPVRRGSFQQPPAPSVQAKSKIQDNSQAPKGPPAVRTAAGGRSFKFSLIQDTQHNKFYDLVVQVVKVFPTRFGDYIEVYVTDYTSNKNLYDYPDPNEKSDIVTEGDHLGYTSFDRKEWPGPWGQMVLRIEVRHPHADYIQNSTKEGDCVELKNVRVKFSQQGKLEANMFPDTLNPQKVLASKLNAAKSEECQQLQSRRSAYWEARQEPEPKYMAKTKKQKKAELRRKAEADARASELAEKKAQGLASDSINKHVRCSHQDVPLSTLSSMLAERGYLQAGGGSDDELPFVNQRRRCQVRAIDYYPAELADFACPALRPVTTDANASDDEMDIDLPSWEWNFFLLVQDGNRPIGPDKTGEKTWVHISDSAAQYLLNMDACE